MGLSLILSTYTLPRDRGLRLSKTPTARQTPNKGTKSPPTQHTLAPKPIEDDDGHTPPEMSLRRILIISLGNPGEYRNTYHSAGHVVLEALQRQLGREQPPFSPDRVGRQTTLASIGPRYSLLQSPAIMNVSGPWVAKAYREHLAERGVGPAELGLVLVHDDLEEELGVVKIRDWKRSHRGHNGVKSVNGALQRPSADSKWARVSVGIGRPDARDKGVVSDFVLSKMSGQARGVLQGGGARGLLEALAELEGQWADE